MVDRRTGDSPRTAVVLYEPPPALLARIAPTLRHHHLNLVVLSHHRPDASHTMSNLILAMHGVTCRTLIPGVPFEEQRLADDLAECFDGIGLLVNFSDARIRGTAVDWTGLGEQRMAMMLTDAIARRVRLIKSLQPLMLRQHAIVVHATIAAHQSGSLARQPGDSVEHMDAMSQRACASLCAASLKRRGVVCHSIELDSGLCGQTRSLKTLLDPLINDRLMASNDRAACLL